MSPQLLRHPEQIGPQVHGARGPEGLAVFQLTTILEEAHHSLIIVELDAMLYEDAAEMAEFISYALGDASKGAAVLLYSPAVDPFLGDQMRNADRVFYFEEGPRTEPRIVAKALSKTQKDQTTLEAFS